MTRERFTNLIVMPFLFISLFYVGYEIGNYNVKPIVKTKIIKRIVPKIVYKTKDSIVSLSYNDLAKDLETNYSFLSESQQKQILNAIKQSSKIYNVNPLVLYALIATESSFRFWIKSPRRLIVGSDGKKHYDNARGLMSIMPKIWFKELQKKKILSKPSELYQIEPNIKAGSYILKVLIDRNKDNVIKALESYFGKSNYAKIYQHKIRAKIGSLIEKEIL